MILSKAHKYLLTVIKDPTYFDSDHESSTGMLLDAVYSWFFKLLQDVHIH
jgi:hypothetical protein